MTGGNRHKGYFAANHGMRHRVDGRAIGPDSIERPPSRVDRGRSRRILDRGAFDVPRDQKRLGGCVELDLFQHREAVAVRDGRCK